MCKINLAARPSPPAPLEEINPASSTNNVTGTLTYLLMSKANARADYSRRLL
jgi:hypothetical protein